MVKLLLNSAGFIALTLCIGMGCSGESATDIDDVPEGLPEGSLDSGTDLNLGDDDPPDAAHDLDLSSNPSDAEVRDASDMSSDASDTHVGDTGPSPEPCPEDRQPPTGMQRVINCDVANRQGIDCRSYAEVFNGVPGSTGIRHVAFNRDQYLSMEVTYPQGVPASARANINTEALQAWPIKKGPVIWSFSTCPGDFNVDAISRELERDCVSSGINANFGFNFGGADYQGDDGRCALTLPAGTTYYLNMLFSADDPSETASTDLEWTCTPSDDLECGQQIQLGSIANW